MLIIGIAGGTGSGKTTVVKKIRESLPEGAVAVIPQDSYYNDQTDMPLEERKKTNFDHPDAFEWPLLSHQIAELRAGRAIEQPTYSYITCTRLKETVHVEPCDVIIVEGIMTLYDNFQRARPISRQKKPSNTSFAQNIRRKMRPAPKKKVNLQYDTESFLQRQKNSPHILQTGRCS